MININLPVKGRLEEQGKFIVEYQGQNYYVKELHFQIEEPVPAVLPCIVLRNEEGNGYEVKQDYRPHLERFYKVGQDYEFTMRADRRSAGYYEVEDRYGFFTRLYKCPALGVGAHVICKVLELSYQIKLQFVGLKAADNSLSSLGADIAALCERAGVDKALATLLTADETDFDTAADAYLRRLTTGTAPTDDLPRLDAIGRVCLHVLEGSGMLRALDPAALARMQARLARMADLCDVLREAIRLIAADEADTTVTGMLHRLAVSGYLYHAQRELQLLERLLALRPELAERHIGEVFDIVRKPENDTLRHDPVFRTAFINILESYIRASRHTIDGADSIEGDDDTGHTIGNAIRALAIQSLLGSGLSAPGFDPMLNRALLYRYLSYTSGANTDVLLEKAYRSVAGEWPSYREFDWADIDIPLLIAQKAAAHVPADARALTTRRYVGDVATLELTSSITLQPTGTRGHRLQKALPVHLLPWHSQQVKLYENIHLQSYQDAGDLRPYEQLWKDVERHLFAPEPAAAPQSAVRRSSRPDVGESVYIRITAPTDDHRRFACCIEDDEYEGRGFIGTDDIVRYNPHATLESFADAAGRPYLLEAVVKAIGEDDVITFEMKSILDELINDENYVDYEETYPCLVTNFAPAYNTYACIGKRGTCFSVPALPGMPHLERGSFINVRLGERFVFGTGNHKGCYEGPAEGENFQVCDAFHNLMDWYADGEVWQPAAARCDEDDTGADVMQADDLLTKAHVTELMKIIDRKAVTTTDYKQAYNYLGMARLFALLLDNRPRADYYANRMRLIMLLQHFEANGAIDSGELREFGEVNGDVVRNYRGLYIQFKRLQTVSFLRAVDRNAELWQTAHETTDPTLARLARLVLTYNLLGEFKLQAGQRSVHTKINELLNIHEKTSALQAFGDEDLHTEFKTSIVFPPDNNMQPDLERQTRKILEVVCGFLNAEGGTLYLGVNNEGMGVGLTEDLSYARFDRKDGSNARDNYDRYVIDNIRLRMGIDAVKEVNGTFVDAAGHAIYRLDIRPCRTLVKVDGDCFRRISSENIHITGDNLRRLEEEKAVTCGTLHGGAPFRTEGAENETIGPEAALPPRDESPRVRLTPIATSTLRRRTADTDSYPLAYLNFLDGKDYMLTDDVFRGNARLQLAINAADEAACVVILYADGAALRVPVGNLLGLKRHRRYTLYADKDVAFAAIAMPADLLMTTRHKGDRQHLTRFDTVERIRQTVGFNDRGALLATPEATLETPYCEIIPAYNKGSFRKLTDLPATMLGGNLAAKSCDKMADALHQMDADIPGA